MFRLLNRLLWLPIALALSGCGGGGVETGVQGSGSTTPFTGPWFLVATMNVNIAGTATFLTDTTEIVVGAGGNVVITSTDSECSLNIFVNGDVLTYAATCVFTATSDDATAPCVLTLVARARIRGTQGSARLSSAFGPETQACSGAAASYAGNLVGSQGSGPDQQDDADNDDDMDNGEDT